MICAPATSDLPHSVNLLFTEASLFQLCRYENSHKTISSFLSQAVFSAIFYFAALSLYEGILMIG